MTFNGQNGAGNLRRRLECHPVPATLLGESCRRPHALLLVVFGLPLPGSAGRGISLLALTRDALGAAFQLFNMVIEADVGSPGGAGVLCSHHPLVRVLRLWGCILWVALSSP